MTRNDTRALDGFLQSFKSLEPMWSKNGQAWLQPVRRAAIARLADIGFPTVHDEERHELAHRHDGFSARRGRC
jgi:hypothetical protein